MNYQRFNISDILFLGNGTLGPSISKNATEMIRNPIKIMDKAKTGYNYSFKNIKIQLIYFPMICY